MKLTPKQQLFIKEYLVDLNATQAAIRAGYSEKTAKSIGQENLTKPDIQRAIQSQMNTRAEKVEISAERILQELGAIAFHDVNDYVTIETNEILRGWRVIEQATEEKEAIIDPIYEPQQRVVLKDTSELTALKKKAIHSIKQGANGIEIKFHDKIKAIELLGKHMKLFSDQLEHSGSITHNNVDMSQLTTEELRKLAKLE